MAFEPSADRFVPGSSVLAAAATLVALGLGLHGSCFWLTRDRGPAAAAYRAAADAVRARYRPGDVIFLVPAYATEAREHLGDLEPLAVRRPLDEDLSVSEHAWLVGFPEAVERTGASFEAAGHERVEAFDFDGLSVSRWRLGGPRARVLWRALDRLREAEVVHVHPDGREEPCDRWSEPGPGGRWTCPHDSAWFYVGPELHRMGEHVRRCLWAHPPRDGQLVIRFFDVPLGGRLLGHAGHTLNASKRAHAAVRFEVKLDDERPQPYEIALEDTWRPWRIPTSTAGTATVGFSIATSDNGANHFCFTAESRGPAEGGLR